jgi:hypothetical protein
MANIRKAKQTRDGWLSVPGAAASLGETRLSVLSRIIRGELVSEQVAGRTVIHRDSVEALLASRAETSVAS